MVTNRCLFVILTLWMVSSRPSASILPGAPVFGAWWGTPQSREIARQADSARRAGDVARADTLYQEGYADAVLRRDERAMVGYLTGIAACQITELHYSLALSTLLEAKRRATSLGDQEALGAIAVNLSNVYLQVWNLESARKAEEDGLVAAGTLRRPYFLPNLLIQLGTSHEVEEDGLAAAFYWRGITAAKDAGNKQLEALGLDLLGEERLQGGDLDAAWKAITEGMRLREAISPSELDLSWWRMGEFEKRRGNWEEAARYTELAINARKTAPEYRLKNQRGQIRMAMGDKVRGLADLREAVELSSKWRLEVLPASSSLTTANEMLDGYVFRSFIEAAAEEALRTGSQKWAEEAFEAVELNRAASLRESKDLADAWHRRVPEEYWETLARFRKSSGNEERQRLRLALSEMEAKAGLGISRKNSESFNDQTSLIHFRRGLGRSEVLLSFYLGERESYLWEVTRDRVQLHKLAERQAIAELAGKFGDSVKLDGPEAVELGERLFKELFGQLGQDAAGKPTWLLSLEGPLFEVPFAALVTEQKDGKGDYLVSKHSVQTIPGALLLSTRPEAGTGGFLGVGDPIYNVADPRWGGSERPGTRTPAEEQYGRLVGSAQELKSSSANWGGPATVLLEGPSARRDIFLGQLGITPSVIHLATHVIFPAGRKEPGEIAFGLGPDGRMEFLTTTDIASLRIPGTFVAMTGCGTGTGDVRQGAGLIGLTRAWQMAGASAVLATTWGVRDSNGDVLASFYKYLRHASPAEALRVSQMEMLGSGTWRGAPSYWAPYQITGGAR